MNNLTLSFVEIICPIIRQVKVIFLKLVESFVLLSKKIHRSCHSTRTDGGCTLFQRKKYQPELMFTP